MYIILIHNTYVNRWYMWTTGLQRGTPLKKLGGVVDYLFGGSSGRVLLRELQMVTCPDVGEP